MQELRKSSETHLFISMCLFRHVFCQVGRQISFFVCFINFIALSADTNDVNRMLGVAYSLPFADGSDVFKSKCLFVFYFILFLLSWCQMPVKMPMEIVAIWRITFQLYTNTTMTYRRYINGGIREKSSIVNIKCYTKVFFFFLVFACIKNIAIKRIYSLMFAMLGDADFDVE